MSNFELNRIYNEDCIEGMRRLPDNSVDSAVTDPPYGLSKEPDINEVLTKWLNGEEYDHKHRGFMGKSWDSFVPHPDIWREVYRVLKPGGHALVFAGTRTQDLMTISLRLAGFEVRDTIHWAYGSGFPKNYNVSKGIDKRYEKKTDLAKQYECYGTALKPAHEPIILVRKPLDGTVLDTVEKWGTGVINIDGCRVASGDDYYEQENKSSSGVSNVFGQANEHIPQHKSPQGRFPANLIHDGSDEVKAEFPESKSTSSKWKGFSGKGSNEGWVRKSHTIEIEGGYDDSGSAARYFKECPYDEDEDLAYLPPFYYTSKASKKDRNSNVEGEQITELNNRHPTVKPTSLLQYLCRLITPEGGIILDPFAGSGSTLVAAKREGFSYIGYELEEEYVKIAEKRVSERRAS